MIKLENVTKTYGGEVVALRNASVDIWHTGFDGAYSAYGRGSICNPGGTSLTADMFCRGVQLTDETGRVTEIRCTYDPDTRQTVRGNLTAQTGNLRIRANVGGAQVYLDGNHQGAIPSGSGVLDLTGLNPGTYELVVVAPGFTTHTSTVRINSGSTSDVRVQQQRR